MHRTKAPRKRAGVDPRLVHIDCSCGWEGRLTILPKAKEEQARHAEGEVMQWEIDAAHYDAILEERRRNA